MDLPFARSCVAALAVTSLAWSLGRPVSEWATTMEFPAAVALRVDGGGAGDEIDFEKQVRPVLARYCFDCHGPEKQKGKIRLDTLDPDLVRGPHAEVWQLALDRINGGEMPPEERPQPSTEERRLVVDWTTRALEHAAAVRKGEGRTVLRRLNKTQYTNTLRELLGLGIEFGRTLPDDAKSELGFTNNGEVLQSSPLLLETYQQIAREGLDQALAIGPRPPTTRYRVRFGKGIGKGLVAGHTGGYQAVPLDTNDFLVEILDEEGRPRVGASPEEKKALDAVRRRISVGLRGSGNDRFFVVDEGMILYGALPHREVAPGSWQGPSPNLKLEMQRVFPERGDFVMRVRASRGYLPPAREELLVELEEPLPRCGLDPETGRAVLAKGARSATAERADRLQNLVLAEGVLRPQEVPKDSNARVRIEIPSDGYYQIDLVHPSVAPAEMPSVRLRLNGRQNLDQRLLLSEAELARPRHLTALGAAVLRGGPQEFQLGGPFFVGFSELVVTPLPPEHPFVRRMNQRTEDLLAAIGDKAPALRGLVGTRTDDGMDYANFDEPQVVEAPLGAAQEYLFHGRLENLPIPEPESGDKEILSGFLLIGVWNDHLVKSNKEPGPPLLVESIEVEAPWHATWPPASHTAIFFDSPHAADREHYTREILERFLERAFRRPVAAEEVERYLAFWRAIAPGYESYEEGIREVLVAALCSPNFLFLATPDGADDAGSEGVGDQEFLASRLSYFLWNSPPDRELLFLAREGRLEAELENQVERMLDDPRRERFVRAFTREWLRLDRQELMAIDANKFPQYTRFVKRDMAEETYLFVERVLAEDLPVATLIDSGFAMLNQNLAEFYGIPGVEGPEFRPVAVTPEQRRGGLLSQGAMLVGHSDGTRPHPIKRAVWLKEKILGERPPAPPPNVPPLDPDEPGFEKLTLKEQLEAHRKNPSCNDCHRSIDPYGVVFENYSAVGLWEAKRQGRAVDAAAVLPDGTTIDGIDQLKAWLLEERLDAVTASLAKHLFAYALGRDLSFADQPELDAILARTKGEHYRIRALLRALVTSRSFLRP